MAAPIYPRIKEMLLEEIQDKPVHTPIASEREMAVRYNASRMTVRNAVNELVAEGYLYKEKNKGTFIADRSMIKKVTVPAAFEEEDDASYSIIYFNIEEAETDVIPHLGIDPDRQIIRIIRIKNKNKRPQSVEELHYARRRIPMEDSNNPSKLLDLNGYIREGFVNQRFIPVDVPVRYINFLHVKMKTPIMLVESTIMTRGGQPRIYIREYINPNEKVIEITS